MLSDLQFLSTEVQASIKDFLDSGVPPDKVALLVDRILHAHEAKTTDLQMSIVRIEEALNARVDRIGDRLAADAQTRFGATNQIAVDTYSAVQRLEAATGELRAGFLQVGERLSEVEQKVAEHDQSRDQSIAERRLLRQDMDASKRHRARLQATQDEMLRRLEAIEQLLTAQHEDGR